MYHKRNNCLNKIGRIGIIDLLTFGFLYNAQICPLDKILSGKSTDRLPFSLKKKSNSKSEHSYDKN